MGVEGAPMLRDKEAEEAGGGGPAFVRPPHPVHYLLCCWDVWWSILGPPTSVRQRGFDIRRGTSEDDQKGPAITLYPKWGWVPWEKHLIPLSCQWPNPHAGVARVADHIKCSRCHSRGRRGTKDPLCCDLPLLLPHAHSIPSTLLRLLPLTTHTHSHACIRTLTTLPYTNGGGGAMKAERVCQSVLPGVHTCSPYEEGMRRGGLVVQPCG